MERQLAASRRTAPYAQAPPPPPPPAAPPSLPKGKGKGKMPAALFGKASRGADGTPMCYGYNLGTCPAPGIAAGGRCPKGLHGCMEPTGAGGSACGAAHPVSAHV